jgi:hypothetical protein
MPTLAQRIPSFDLGIAAHASGSDTHYKSRLYVRVGHRSEEVGRRSEGVGHRSPFGVRLSEYLEHAEIDAAMRFVLGALRSLFLEHAHVFGAMRSEPTTDAPRRTSAFLRVRRASLRVASATVGTRKEALPVPRGALPVPGDALPIRRDALLIRRDVAPVPLDAPPTPRDAPPTPRHAPPVPLDAPPTPLDAPLVRRASPNMKSTPLLIWRAPLLPVGDPLPTCPPLRGSLRWTPLFGPRAVREESAASSLRSIRSQPCGAASTSERATRAEPEGGDS